MMGALRRATTLLVGLLMLLWSARALAAYTPPPIAGHVTDPAGRLNASDTAYLNEKLASYRRCSSNPIAVFFPTSLDGNSIEDVAYATFNTWRLGEAKKDNGVLLVLATAERKVRIETGKAVGGQLTDVESAHILRDDVNPHMKAGQFFAAADKATTSIAKALGGCDVAAAKPVPKGQSFASYDESVEIRVGLSSVLTLFVAVALVVLELNLWIAAGVGVTLGVASFGLVTFVAREPQGDNIGTIVALLLTLNAVAGLGMVAAFIVRSRRRKRGKKRRRGRNRGGGGGDGGFWSGSGGSDYSGGGGGSDYSGGGGHSGGGGASDSY